MSAYEKTKAVGRQFVPVSQIIPAENNPNSLSKRAFDLLVDNIERTGLTDPILVRALPDGRFRIVGGHHRFDGALYLGFPEVPVTVIDDPDFDDEAEAFQLVRMNVIRGKMDPESFLKLYDKVSAKYAEDVLQDLFGFAEKAEFDKLVKQTAKSLPKELKDQFLEAAKEVKTVDGLARILNELFTRYGQTVHHGYMVLDYGGQQHVWVQVSKDTMKGLRVIGEMCIERSRTMDDVLGGLVKMIAKGDLKDQVETLIETSPQVVLPTGLQVAPTKQNLTALSALD